MSTRIGYWDAYMPKFRVETVAATGKSLPVNSGIQDSYVDFIAVYWQSPGHGETLCVLLKEQTAQNWWTLGRVLTTDLLGMGRYAGLSFEGQLPLAIELAWLPQYLGGNRRSVVNLTVWNNEHPTKTDRTIKNVAWASIEAVQGSSWLVWLWGAVQSDWYDYGCNLLITVYETDVIAPLAWDEALGIKTFGATLAHAVGWIAPMDGNLGFFIGIPADSILHSKLHAEQSTT